MDGCINAINPPAIFHPVLIFSFLLVHILAAESLSQLLALTTHNSSLGSIALFALFAFQFRPFTLSVFPPSNRYLQALDQGPKH